MSPRFAGRLLKWFDGHRRDLPWRRDRDPYRVWVSEVMLQQTTVAAVVPYFERFLAAFPTVRHLADADEQSVLRLWQGLGYYRRARHLHSAARELVAQFGDDLPDDPAAWAALPGVGRYILGAVLSQAFNRRLPIVEANTQRLLCRLFGETGDPTTGPVKARLWLRAEEILPAKRVGDFNQAMMELGSLVCTPAAPRCRECPVSGDCEAFHTSLQHEIPAKAKRVELTDVRAVAVVVWRTDQFLLVQRPADAKRWASMWEFPSAEIAADTDPIRAVRRLLRDLNIRAKLGAEIVTIRHGVTRFRITLTAHEAAHAGGDVSTSAYADHRWVTADEVADYPLPTAHRRVAAAVANGQRRLF